MIFNLKKIVITFILLISLILLKQTVIAGENFRVETSEESKNRTISKIKGVISEDNSLEYFFEYNRNISGKTIYNIFLDNTEKVISNSLEIYKAKIFIDDKERTNPNLFEVKKWKTEFVYEPDQMAFHNVSEVVKDDDTLNGFALMVKAEAEKSEMKCFSYGPYAREQLPGGYWVGFRLKISDNKKKGIVVRIDAYNSSGSGKLVEKEISYSDFIQPNTYQMFYLHYIRIDEGSMEYRCYWTGEVDVWLDRVEVYVPKIEWEKVESYDLRELRDSDNARIQGEVSKFKSSEISLKGNHQNSGTYRGTFKLTTMEKDLSEVAPTIDVIDTKKNFHNVYISKNLVITRIIPNDKMISCEWGLLELRNKTNKFEYIVEYKLRSDQWTNANKIVVSDEKSFVDIYNLQNDRDYTLRVMCKKINNHSITALSEERLATPGAVPGVVIDYLHKDDPIYVDSGNFVGSPSIAKLSGGSYVASHDIFGLGKQNLTRIFCSDNKGKNWKWLTDISPAFWGKLFTHYGKLYLLSTDGLYGNIIIRCSEDGGSTWTEPSILLYGKYHKGPVPIIIHNKRLWTAIEKQTGDWPKGFQSCVISVPIDADLLDPNSWIATPYLAYNHSWEGTLKEAESPGFLEGNVVVTPTNELVNILRYHTAPKWDKAIILKINQNDPQAALVFDRVIDFIGGITKFHINYHTGTKRYWSLVNRVTRDCWHQRNVLSLVSSQDLIQWRFERDILDFADQDNYTDNLMDMKIGVQYIDWLFEDNDIIGVSRMALNGANNFHDANYLTFHRIKNFSADNSIGLK